ncbi:TolC family outer membrane protein [Henriciella litoralis]|uniref:TolC family outer membrane protein n=1 Tax=Henriciella litoralis TaxID=568102 RepID=UPI000A02BAAE|nr:TolC family outer membrane protein [Henriciella litoralis]
MRKTAIVTGFILAGMLLAPEASHAETLQDALTAAWLNNPSLEARRDELDIADERIEQARAQRRPTVNLFGGYQYESIDSNRPIAFNLGDRPVASAQIEARLPVYTGGRLNAGIRQAEAGSRVAEAQLDSAGQGLLLDTVTAYVDILRDRQVIDIRKNSIGLLEGQFTAASDRFEVGDITRTDVALARARLEGGTAQLAAAQAQLEASLAIYALITGLEAGDLAPVPPLPDVPASFDDALEVALSGNPDIEAALQAESAAREGVALAEGALKPEVSLIGQAGIQEYHVDGFRDTSVVAGAEARVPLFTGGLNTSRVREARLARNQARSQIDLNRRIVRTNVARAWYGLEAATQSVSASERQVEAAELAFEGAREELSVGTRTTLDVLDQEQQLLEARLALATSRRDRYVAAHQLLAAMGQLTPDRLGMGMR